MIEVTTAAPTPAQLRERLTAVIDPEVGINIVDLGLVRDLRVDDHAIEVVMTMTTPACPLGPYLEAGVQAVLGEIAGHRLVLAEVTFDPPWSPEEITPAGRAALGWS